VIPNGRSWPQAEIYSPIFTAAKRTLPNVSNWDKAEVYSWIFIATMHPFAMVLWISGASKVARIAPNVMFHAGPRPLLIARAGLVLCHT